MELKRFLPVSIKNDIIKLSAVIVQNVSSILFPVKQQALFESFDGKQYSDNPKAISEKLHEIDPSFQIVWAFRNVNKIPENVPDYVKIVRRNSFDFYKVLATSFAYIRNTQFESWVRKRKGEQIFFQPWHGDRALKKILYQKNSSKKIIVCDNELVDYCISGSEFGTNLFRDAFHYNGEVLEVGCPRNDILLSDKCDAVGQRIRKIYNIATGTKILLYAPTFRDNSMDVQTALVDIKQVLSTLERTTNQKWVCLVRAHSNVLHGLDIEFSENIIDVSGEGDAADLLCATDFLISDYSSIATDYALRKKPVILAVFDEENYIENSREFSVTPKETGFYTATDNLMLMSIIENASEEEYKKRCNYCLTYYKTNESGKAAFIVANLIVEKHKHKIAN